MSDVEKYNHYKRNIIKIGLGLALVFSIIAIISKNLPVAKGIALGGLFSVFNFHLIARRLVRNIDKNFLNSKKKLAINFLGRLVILSIPLIIASKIKDIHILGVCIGLFIIQIAIFFENFILKKIFKPFK